MKAAAFDPAREFERLLRSLVGRHQLWRVFADFCELAALSLANPIERRTEREERYQQVLTAYEPAEQAIFPQLLGCVVVGLGESFETDFLGERFTSLELASHWHGQYFTPMSLCRMTAQLLLDQDIGDAIRERGFVRIQEPACGAGALVIAFAGALKAAGFNAHQHLHVTAIDIDATAAHMAFVQLALLGLPAEVLVGDTLRLQFRGRFLTPFHHLGLWDTRLRSAPPPAAPPDTEPAPEVVEEIPTQRPPSRPRPPVGTGQIPLF